MSKKDSYGYKGFKQCDICQKKNDPSRVFTNRVEADGISQRVFKFHDKEDCDHDYYDDECESEEFCGCYCEPCHKPCPDKVKGFDFCKKKEEIKCFKHCAPISQPCDCCKYNYFTSRANLDFSGLIVVKNTSNLTSNCSMKVCLTDSCGTAGVATVNPGSSVSLFVEGLSSLDISCFKHASETTDKGLCVGEVIFDLEYCTIQYTSDHDCSDF
ncbi:S-Ena type endospore appendage [Halobacillus faecis]|uniref:S-Ena type endospore appendage n=1 Tax=Halobacillus faecis TaxID=360184 RepID=UPI0011BD6080|nr:S-Ena type endospore appendage [Halobacillus faecis]